MAKQRKRSRTHIFNVIMGTIQSVNGSIALLQPILTAEQFAYTTIVIGALHAAGGLMLREMTKEPIA